MRDGGHRRFEEMAAAYAGGALDLDDRRLLEQHLEMCADCRALVRELSQAAEALPRGVPQVAAPAALKGRVLAAVHEEAARDRSNAAPNVSPAERPHGSKPDGRARSVFTPARLALAASFTIALVTVAGLLAWGLSLRNEVEDRDALVARSYDALSVMASADARWVVEGTDAAPEAYGVVAYDEERGEASVVMWGLDEDPSVRYNVWVQEAGERTPVGRLYAADGGFWAIVREDVRQTEAIGVTRFAADGGTAVVLDAVLGE